VCISDPQDPYFPKGNISLQYASSCDSVGGARFKLRTTERNYTFTADNEANAEEWIRVINKVIFKRQQEGETVRLIIPLEAVIDVELGPSLEFAETIEVKVVDSDDSMSIDSYFFASFPDNEHTYNVLQNLLDSRPSVQLPKLSSETTLQTYTNDGASDATMPEATASASVSATSGTNIIPKIGAVLRPLGLSRESKSDNRVPIAPPPRPSLPEHYHRSSSELEHGSEVESTDQEGGYPPRQSGAPPPGMEHRQSWRDSWIRNPASKLFGPQAPLERKEGKEGKDKGDGAKRRRPSVRKPVSVSVTEVIEPAPPLSSDEDDFSGTESATTLSPSSKTHASGSDDNDPMEQQFHTFFALPNKEKLITRE
jgi:sterol 3beta-glucosyltransferase